MWYSSLKFCIIFFIFNLTAKNEKSGTRHLQWRSSNEGIIIFFQNIRSLYFRCLKFFFMFTEIFTRTARTKNFDFWAQRLLGLEKTLKHNMCWKHIYLFIYLFIYHKSYLSQLPPFCISIYFFLLDTYGSCYQMRS